MASFNGNSVVMQAPLPASVVAGDVLTSLNWMPSFTAFNNTYRNNRARYGNGEEGEEGTVC